MKHIKEFNESKSRSMMNEIEFYYLCKESIYKQVPIRVEYYTAAMQYGDTKIFVGIPKGIFREGNGHYTMTFWDKRLPPDREYIIPSNRVISAHYFSK